MGWISWLGIAQLLIQVRRRCEYLIEANTLISAFLSSQYQDSWGFVKGQRRISGAICAAQSAVTVLQHDAADAVTAGVPSLFGLFSAVFTPRPRETIAVDGKVLRGSYEVISDDPTVKSHPAIMLVTAYLVERGLILEPYEVDSKTNEIKALPAFIEHLALQGVVFAFDALSTLKDLFKME